MTVEIIRVCTSDQMTTVESLAKEIWPEHFISIIGSSQVDYMLEKFQSAEAILAQINSGYEYFFVLNEDEPVGYTALVPDSDAKRLMLSKIYVKKSARWKGVGKSILNFVEKKCVLEGFSCLWLTVNRFNKGPILWYENRGFTIVDKVKKDIGSGYIMDDYVMEREF